MLLETVLRSLSRKEPHHHVLSRSRNAIRSGSDGSGSKLNVQHKMAQSVTVFFLPYPSIFLTILIIQKSEAEVPQPLG
jgi:hypothetical protein